MNASRSARGSPTGAAPIHALATSNITACMHSLLLVVMVSSRVMVGRPTHVTSCRLGAGGRHDLVPAVATRLDRRDAELGAPRVHRLVPAVLPPDAHERPGDPCDLDAGAH